MKKIGAKSTSGPEAIIVVLIQWWWPRCNKHKIHELFEQHRSEFNFKSEFKLGQTLDKINRKIIDDIIIQFMNCIKQNDIGKYAMEQATRENQATDCVQWTRNFIRKSFVSLVGEEITCLKNKSRL